MWGWTLQVDKVSIHHIDVGQGDATLITAQYKKNIVLSVLIDIGPDNTSVQRVIQFCKYKFSRNNNDVNRPIDYMVFTHFDRDHIGDPKSGSVGWETLQHNGLITGKTQVYAPKTGGTNASSITFSNANTVNAIFVEPVLGADILGGQYEGMKITVLAFDDKCLGAKQPTPTDDHPRDTLTNRSSIVLLLQYGDFVYYTGGDADYALEDAIACNLDENLTISAIKLSHHGSDTATPESLIARCASPVFAIIRTGENPHEHPNSPALARVLQRQENGKKTNKTGLTMMTGLNERVAAMGSPTSTMAEPYTIGLYESYRHFGIISLRKFKEKMGFQMAYDNVHRVENHSVGDTPNTPNVYELTEPYMPFVVAEIQQHIAAWSGVDCQKVYKPARECIRNILLPGNQAAKERVRSELITIAKLKYEESIQLIEQVVDDQKPLTKSQWKTLESKKVDKRLREILYDPRRIAAVAETIISNVLNYKSTLDSLQTETVKNRREVTINNEVYMIKKIRVYSHDSPPIDPKKQYRQPEISSWSSVSPSKVPLPPKHVEGGGPIQAKGFNTTLPDKRRSTARELYPSNPPKKQKQTDSNEQNQSPPDTME